LTSFFLSSFFFTSFLLSLASFAFFTCFTSPLSSSLSSPSLVLFSSPTVLVLLPASSFGAGAGAGGLDSAAAAALAASIAAVALATFAAASAATASETSTTTLYRNLDRPKLNSAQSKLLLALPLLPLPPPASCKGTRSSSIGAPEQKHSWLRLWRGMGSETALALA
jgi:hypothetical protein